MKHPSSSLPFCLLIGWIAVLFSLPTSAQVERVEPGNWWIGMKTPLQLLVYGKDLSGFAVTSPDPNLIITKVHPAESPNYLFIDVELTPQAKAGKYILQFTRNKKTVRYPYTILDRELHSANRSGFSAADMMYLIMPDRFANGDPTNDSTGSTLEKANRASDNGRHGGDIQGIINHLDYLKELGVTALWNTPLLLDNEERSSYHGYACADYYRIDPRYGSNDLFRELVAEAHQRGIKIIMDFVPNHCGTAHWWMKDLPFASWVNPKGTYTGSFHAIGSLPDTNGSQLDREDVVRTWFSNSMPDMNLENPYVLNYFTQLAVWWIEWSGLDGFRIDTYPYLSKNSMAALMQSVRTEYPAFNIVGECWRSYPSLIAYWQEGQHVCPDGFDSHLPSVMDFPLSTALTEGKRSFADKLMQVYDNLSQDFLYTNPDNLLIFADNHDKTRLATQVTDLKEQKLTMALLATLRGIPQLYYGTELAFAGAREKGKGDAQRQDFPGGWASDSVNLFDKAQRNPQQQELFDYTARLFTWRRTATPIHSGKTLHFKPNKGVYTYFRYTSDRCVMVAVNGNEEPVPLDWKQYSEITDRLDSGPDINSGTVVHPSDAIVIGGKEAVIVDFKMKQ